MNGNRPDTPSLILDLDLFERNLARDRAGRRDHHKFSQSDLFDPAKPSYRALIENRFRFPVSETFLSYALRLTFNTLSVKFKTFSKKFSPSACPRPGGKTRFFQRGLLTSGFFRANLIEGQQYSAPGQSTEERAK